MSESKETGFGKALQNARKAAQMDMRELSDTTKIQTRYIEALEAEQFDRVPGGIIGRGFVRLVAKELGGDVEHLVELYKVTRGEEEAQSMLPPAETEWRVGPPVKPWPDMRVVAMGGALLVIALVLVWVWSPWSDDESSQPVDTGTIHRLELRATARTWVRVEAQGLEGERQPLEPTETLSFEAPAPVTLELPDVDAVRLTWDGEALKSPKSAGEITIVVLPTDLETLKP